MGEPRDEAGSVQTATKGRHTSRRPRVDKLPRHVPWAEHEAPPASPDQRSVDRAPRNYLCISNAKCGDRRQQDRALAGSASRTQRPNLRNGRLESTKSAVCQPKARACVTAWALLGELAGALGIA